MTLKLLRLIWDHGALQVLLGLALFFWTKATALLFALVLALFLSLDATVVTGRSVRHSAKSLADQREEGRKRKHELQMQRERFARDDADRIRRQQEVASRTQKSREDINEERLAAAQKRFDEDIRIAEQIPDEALRETMKDLAADRYGNALGNIVYEE